MVVGFAVQENRILITEDKDFGQLVYANARASGGVVLIRFPAGARAALPKAVVDLTREMGEQLIGRFVVLQPGRIRMGI